MNKLNLLYTTMSIAVIALVAFLLYSAIHQLDASTEEPATITSQALIELENYSIVHLTISNNEGGDINYTICTFVDNSTRCFDQPIKDEKMFTYKHYVRPDKNEEKEVNIVIYKEAETGPIENITYYVSMQNQ